MPLTAFGIVVSRRSSTRLTVSSAQGADFEIAVKTATVPVLSRVGSETAATSGAAATCLARTGSDRSASSAVWNLEVISRGPLTPGPKPFVIES